MTDGGRTLTNPGGIKLDSEKPDMALFSSMWLFATARVLTFGKRKYAAHNWRQGLQISRLMSAALRHIFAFLSGEDKDPETGESHLAHATCCLMFALETLELRPEMDDRWKAPNENKTPVVATADASDRHESAS